MRVPVQQMKAAPDDGAAFAAKQVFAGKVRLRTKVAFAVVLVILFACSFFAGAYSVGEGYTLGRMLGAVREHIIAYAYVWSAFLSGALELPGAHAGFPDGSFASRLWFALSGAGTSWLVSDPKIDLALFSVRLPRLALVMLVGAALPVAGGAYQGMFKNPLVSPDLLGASSGASLGACAGMLANLPGIGVQAAAFVGGIAAVGLTVRLRRAIRADAVLGLVLAGMLVSTLFSSAMSFVKTVADASDKLPAITYWLMGSFSDVAKQDFWLALVPITAGLVLVFSQRWQLNALSFGDDEACSLGVNTGRTRLIVILGATLVSSASVAVAGIIGWIGLVIPHFARAAVGPSYKVLLPACLFAGAAYLLCIDDIARLLLRTEIPIGVLTSLLGIPLFFVIFKRTRRGW